MIRFLDGPAAGQVLTLQRAPVLLRVVQNRKGDWDALDQLSDTPAADETIHVYRIEGVPTRMHVSGRTGPKGGRRFGAWYACAEYRLLPFQPTDEQARTNEAWAAWCDSVKDRVLSEATQS